MIIRKGKLVSRPPFLRQQEGRIFYFIKLSVLHWNIVLRAVKQHFFPPLAHIHILILISTDSIKMVRL